MILEDKQVFCAYLFEFLVFKKRKKEKKVARMSNKCKSEGKMGNKNKKMLWFEIPISGIGFFEL